VYSYDGAGSKVLERRGSHYEVSIDRRFVNAQEPSFEERRFTIEVSGKPIAEIVWNKLRASTAWTRHDYYLHVDQLGSVTAVTDASGSVTDRFAYDPFGTRQTLGPAGGLPAATGSGTRFGFTGHLHDERLNLIDMRRRIYDPYLRRFLTRDPVIADVTRPLHFDPYSYVFNSPLRLVDPTGYFPEVDWIPPTSPESQGDCTNAGCTLEGETFTTRASARAPDPAPSHPAGGERRSPAPPNDDGLGQRATPLAGDKSFPADVGSVQQPPSGLQSRSVPLTGRQAEEIFQWALKTGAPTGFGRSVASIYAETAAKWPFALAPFPYGVYILLGAEKEQKKTGGKAEGAIILGYDPEIGFHVSALVGGGGGNDSGGGALVREWTLWSSSGQRLADSLILTELDNGGGGLGIWRALGEQSFGGYAFFGLKHWAFVGLGSSITISSELRPPLIGRAPAPTPFQK
jgi:RHS repeat-associated protein